MAWFSVQQLEAVLFSLHAIPIMLLQVCTEMQGVFDCLAHPSLSLLYKETQSGNIVLLPQQAAVPDYNACKEARQFEHTDLN